MTCLSLPIAATLIAMGLATIPARAEQEPAPAAETARITVHASALAQLADLAGYPVRVPHARVVGVFEPHAFLIETASQLRPFVGNRDRILVLVERGTLRVSPEVLVASNVTVLGVARTLLGMQVSREVPWPAALDRRRLDRLDIRAAVLAASVQTADGVELTVQP
jgi:hypothetical protein